MKKFVALLQDHRLWQWLLTSCSLAFVVLFAKWWFQVSHLPLAVGTTHTIFDLALFLSVSYIIWHPIVMEVLTWIIALNIEKKEATPRPEPGKKVAFITTIVPKSEPIELLHNCLPAMMRASYPHDTWILDESNSPEVKKICALYGVKHFSRLTDKKYNSYQGQFSKTKGGNHNSWYDAYGKDYDFVAQIDTDFVPKPDFLTKTLGYFRNPEVAFVGTPQIYGNINTSFIARGSAEQQYSFYGSVLRGLHNLGMTLLIGANHVIRVKAFKEVDFYTAHITEDLITGIKLHANGWKSVYVPQALAVGEGPTTWEAYFNQQLRWAYGCIDILFNYSIKQFKKLGWRQSIFYFFLQQHYFSGVSMALSAVLLFLYFIFSISSANVSSTAFFSYYTFSLLICWLMSVWLQRYNIEKNSGDDLQLAGRILNTIVWPIWFIAFVNVLMRKRLTYKVTPKGDTAEIVYSIVPFIPHFIVGSMAGVGFISSFVSGYQNPVMLIWALMTMVAMYAAPYMELIYKVYGQISNKFHDRFEKSLLLSPKATLLLETSKEELSQNPFREKLKDCIFLATVVVASCITYLGKIGFYSDDWSFLGNFYMATDKSIWALFLVASTPNTFMRPVQNIYDVLLFHFFGIDPLGYQIVNTIVFTAIILIFYLILRKVRLPRIMSLSVPLIYALLPNYSTDRFWYAAFQVNLSMLLYFVSAFAGLKALERQAGTALGWKILSLSTLILSALSYEITLPMVLLSCLLFWNPIQKLFHQKNNQETPNKRVFIVMNLITIAYLFAFKLFTTTRIGAINNVSGMVNLLKSIFSTNFGLYIWKLPSLWHQVVTENTQWPILIFGTALFLFMFFYLYRVISKSKQSLKSALSVPYLGYLGVAIFLLGYALFFANNSAGFSPTGVDNRVTLAASIGFALVIFWLICRVCAIFLRPYSQFIYSGLVSLVCTGGFFLITYTANFWIKAYQQSSTVLSEIQNNIPRLPEGSTFILDGVCPYVGPGIVFESQYDLKGALQIYYLDPELKADVVSPRMKIQSDGLVTSIYSLQSVYPYKDLFIYNYKTKQLQAVENEEQAKNYFAAHNHDMTGGCPIASVGHGVSIYK